MKQTSHFEIGLDFRMGNHTGIGTYLRGLVKGFHSNQQPESSRLALYKPAGLDSETDFSEMLFSSPIYSWQEQFAYPQLLNTCRLWHAPHYNVPYSKGRAKLVTTIHDIIHWKFRHTLNFFQRTYAKMMLTRAIEISDHIITVSRHTKNDLIQHFNASPEKISVVYNGVSTDFRPIEQDERDILIRPFMQKYRLPNSYFLYVGMIKPHKNVLRLLRVYLKLRKEKKIQSGLVIIGQGASNSEEMKILKDTNNQIIHLPRIGAGDLPLFYNTARALVHPSLYEGFGLTVVEALACGTPVITTRQASLPEVGGEAANYIHGEDDVELANVLLKFDRNPEIKEKGFDANIRQASKFSWKKRRGKRLKFMRAF